MIKWLISLLLLLISTHEYLELKMMRVPQNTTFKSSNKVQCITPEIDKALQEKRKKSTHHKDDQSEVDEDSQYQDQQVDDEQNYKEICYEKDISYSILFYYHNNLKYFSVDLTTPISWLKGQNCHIEASSKKCTPVSQNLKDALSGIFHSVSKHFGKKIKKKDKKLAMIQGSSELVKGQMEKSQNIQFTTRDSSRFTKFTELIMLGFWMKGEKDTLQIQNTTFINATQISSNLNNLCDGAISLRFDQMSEKSFLQQIFDYVKTSQKTITIYLGKYQNNTITIGDMSTKNAQSGYGGINWITLEDDESYGKVPTATDLIIQNEDKDEDPYQEFNDLQMPTVLTLSASYIGLPKKLMNDFHAGFKEDRQCGVNQETNYFQCNKTKKGDLDKILTIVFDSTKISFQLSQLVQQQRHKKIVFNIKKTFHDEYAILGEPVFKKYFTVLDYAKNKIGFSNPKINKVKEFISIVTLVRCVSAFFILALFMICCYLPFQRFLSALQKKGISIVKNKKSGEKRKLKQYEPINDDHYDDLNKKVKQALSDDD